MPIPRLKERYHQTIVPALKAALNYTSVIQVPRLEKICINQGIGGAIANPKLLEAAIQELTLIAGQRAVPTKAKRSISNFKLRQGMSIGARVTLRGKRMYEFMDRLVTVVLPRIKDFRGVSEKAFDKQGNYTLGIKEQHIFPEISIDKVTRITGMNITLVTSCTDPKKSYALLKELGLPFKDLHQKQ